MIDIKSVTAVVFADGTAAPGGDGLTKESAVNTLSAAAKRLCNGGTIVIAGDVKIDSAEDITAGGAIVITSVYDGKDYKKTAAVKISADIALHSDTTFKDIVLEKAGYADNYICANGNRLVVEKGVFCRNNLATSYLNICGGVKEGDFEGNSDITIKSGYFKNVYGGNLNGNFKGNVTVNFLGGYVDHTLAGGNRLGNFEGGVTVNMGGDAVLADAGGDALGMIGGTQGDDTAEYTFVGDIYINLYGTARLNNDLYGAAYGSKTVTDGNVNITVKDDANVWFGIYAGGYDGTLNGDTRLIVDGGWVGTNITGGCCNGTANGDTYIEINGGEFGYYFTHVHSSMSATAGTHNVGGGGSTGTVNGNTTVIVNGGDIYGNLYGGAISTGEVTGNCAVTVKGGRIWCGVYADGKTQGTISGAKTLDIDLSDGGAVSIGVASDVTSLVGGGSLTLFPEATITAETFSGNIDLAINGIPQARDYITATSYEGATVNYTVQDDEVFVSEGGVYGVSSKGYFETTKIIIKHVKGVEIYMRAGMSTEVDKITASELYDESTVYDLAPGIYNYTVYHGLGDYKRCHWN